ncbi:MAG: hypothetical protein LAP38_04375 [Acidobacteriia bacterium]|nr:hypothetical protein [Terriglobia bacterium]
MKPAIASRLAVLLLAALALIFGTGCLDTPDPAVSHYILKCEGGTLQLYLVSVSKVPGATAQPVNNPINGQDCSVSTELQGRPLTLSEAVEHNLVQGGFNQPSTRRAASNSPFSLIDTFVNLVPLPLGPPVTITSPGCNATTKAYLVNHTNGTVTAVGTCPLSILKVIPVGSNPLQVAITPDGSTALVTRYDNDVVWIDTNTDQVTFTLPTGGVYPSGIAISPDGTRAYVTNYFNTNPSLLVIDVVNRAILTTVPLGGAYPRSATITPDGSQVWVNYYNGTGVDIVDTLTLTVAAGIRFNAIVSTGMAFNPTGTKAFIATSPNLLAVVDTKTLNTLATITVGSEPMDVAVTADGALLFVTSYNSNIISLVDAIGNRLVQNLPTDAGAMGLTLIPAGLH